MTTEIQEITGVQYDFVDQFWDQQILPTLQEYIKIPAVSTLALAKAEQTIKKLLAANPPYHCKVELHVDGAAAGWNAKLHPDWLTKSLAETSQARFKSPVRTLQEGGSIGAVNILEAKYPDSPFVVTGVLGPGSNAHAPYENLDIAYAKSLTRCIADLLGAFSKTA